MNCRNSVTLIGHICQDCEVFTFESGSKKATFNLATSDRYTNAKGEVVDTTEWHKCEGWGKQAEIMEKYFKKGTEVALQGSLRTDNYEDKSGNKRSRTYVRIDNFTFVGKKQKAEVV